MKKKKGKFKTFARRARGATSARIAKGLGGFSWGELFLLLIVSVGAIWAWAMTMKRGMKLPAWSMPVALAIGAFVTAMFRPTRMIAMPLAAVAVVTGGQQLVGVAQGATGLAAPANATRLAQWLQNGGRPAAPLPGDGRVASPANIRERANAPANIRERANAPAWASAQSMTPVSPGQSAF